MDLLLAGQHVLITGGSKGIGLACARAFLDEGARVSLVSRTEAHLARARGTLGAGPDRVFAVAADLTRPEAGVSALDAAEAHFGPVAVLVNSAGAAKRTPFHELTPAAWHDAMDAKYFSTLHMLDPAIQRMGARGAGVVVNVVGAGGKVASPIHLAGGAANAALMLVTAGLAQAYGPKGVRVNAVNPGLTRTERLKEGLAADARIQGISPAEAEARAVAKLPLGRMAEPEDVAAAVVFLASPRAAAISGAILAMDGAVTPMVV